MKTEEIKILKMALQVVGLEVSDCAIDAFIQVKEAYDMRGDKFDLKDACEIRAKLYEKHGGGYCTYTMCL